VMVDAFNLVNWQGVETVNQQYTNAAGMGQQGGTLAQARVLSSDGSTFRPIYASDKNPNFLLPTSYQNPRYFRFGIRGTF